MRIPTVPLYVLLLLFILDGIYRSETVLFARRDERIVHIHGLIVKRKTGTQLGTDEKHEIIITKPLVGILRYGRPRERRRRLTRPLTIRFERVRYGLHVTNNTRTKRSCARPVYGARVSATKLKNLPSGSGVAWLRSPVAQCYGESVDRSTECGVRPAIPKQRILDGSIHMAFGRKRV